MGRFLKRALLLLLTLALALGAYLYLQVSRLSAESVTADTWVLRGLGGNVTVLRTGAGTVLVDSMTFRLQGRLIRRRAESITGEPVVLIINTHYHFDHTHGNPAFPTGIRVVATERTLAHLQHFEPDHWRGAEHALPGETFVNSREIRLGDKTIQVLHPGRGHTDGDLVALFVEDRVLSYGDLLFLGHYPNIDLEAGGSVQAWPATLDGTLDLPFEHAVPGHGVTTSHTGVRHFRTFMQQLAELGQAAASEGWTLEQTATRAAQYVTADEGFEPIRFVVPLGLDRDFVIRRAWEEATGAVTGPSH